MKLILITMALALLMPCEAPEEPTASDRGDSILPELIEPYIYCGEGYLEQGQSFGFAWGVE
jgi:hypothetical protein